MKKTLKIIIIIFIFLIFLIVLLNNLLNFLDIFTYKWALSGLSLYAINYALWDLKND